MWRVTCSLYFDLNRDGFRDFWIWAPIILAIIVGGGLLDWFWGHLFGASTVRRYLGWFFLLLVLSFFLASAIWYYKELSVLANLMQTQSVQFIVGTVEDVRPAPAKTLGPIERFRIGSTDFSYAPYTIAPGFRQRLGRENPIQQGACVRLGTVETVIIRVELCARGDGEHSCP